MAAIRAYIHTNEIYERFIILYYTAKYEIIASKN